MTHHETQHETQPGRETPEYGDIIECRRCGTETALAPGGPVACPECGNALVPEPITRDTDAPAPG